MRPWKAAVTAGAVAALAVCTIVNAQPKVEVSIGGDAALRMRPDGWRRDLPRGHRQDRRDRKDYAVTESDFMLDGVRVRASVRVVREHGHLSVTVTYTPCDPRRGLPDLAAIGLRMRGERGFAWRPQFTTAECVGNSRVYTAIGCRDYFGDELTRIELRSETDCEERSVAWSCVTLR